MSPILNFKVPPFYEKSTEAAVNSFRFIAYSKYCTQGYMVGNGVTDDEFDGNALVPFAHGMGLISDELFEVGSLSFLYSF